MPSLINEKKIFDLIFIDGSHEYEIVVQDFLNAIKLSNKNTLIIADDVYLPDDKQLEVYQDFHNSGNKSLVRVN